MGEDIVEKKNKTNHVAAQDKLLNVELVDLYIKQKERTADMVTSNR